MLALCLFVWPLLLDIPLLDPDEGLHASIAQEMLERGEWVAPTFLGQPFFDKPILFFWAQLASIATFGQSEGAVRLPCLFFGALGVLATGLLARDLFGGRTALIAGVMQATMLAPLAQSQAGGHDVALVPCTTFALLFLRRADMAATTDIAGETTPSRRAMRPLALASLLLGLSILTKGLAGVALVLAPAVAILAVERRLTFRRLAGLGVCAGAAVAIALPWYMAMEHAHPGYLRYYFVERHLLGFAIGSARHAGRPWWYYVPVLLAGGFPWALYLPAAAHGVWSRAKASPTATVTSVWIWLVAGLLFLTIARVKLWTYPLPLFPAIAILAAHAWTRAIGESWPNTPRSMTWAVTIHVLLGSLLMPAIWIDSRNHGLEASFALGCCAAAIVAIYVWAQVTFVRRLNPYAWVALANAMVATAVATLTLVMPTVAESMSARDLARHVNRTGTMPARMVVLDDRIGSFVFYLAPGMRRELTPARLASVPIFAMRDEIDRMPPDTVVAIRERRAEPLERTFAACQADYVRAGQFRLYRARILQGCGR